jgi:hypothetical protein
LDDPSDPTAELIGALAGRLRPALLNGADECGFLFLKSNGRPYRPRDSSDWAAALKTAFARVLPSTSEGVKPNVAANVVRKSLATHVVPMCLGDPVALEGFSQLMRNT